MQKSIKTHYARLGMRGQTNPIPSILTHFSYTALQVLSFLNGYKSSSPRGMMRVMESSECPPGIERSVMGPSSSSSSGSESWGGFWSVLSSDVWLQWSSGSPALEHSHIGISFRGAGAIGLAGAPVSILSSLSLLDNHIWITLQEAVVDHGNVTGIPLF